MTNPYEDLAVAVAAQAAQDWRGAVRVLKRRPRNEAARQVRDECEEFFRSEWFETLTNLDGRVILRKLKQEAHLHDNKSEDESDG